MILDQADLLSAAKPVDATVDSVGIERFSPRRRSLRGVKCAPVVAYRYDVGGRTYSSKSVFPLPQKGSETWALEIVSRYDKGQTCRAYVDPRDPRRAFLLPVVDFDWYFYVFIACVVLLLGSVYFYFVPKSEPAPPLPTADGWFELPPGRSMAQKARFVAVAAVLWHVAGALLAGHYFSIAAGSIENFGLITCIVYEALGVIPILTYLHYRSLRTKLGDQRVFLSCASPVPGEAFRVRVTQDALSDQTLAWLRVSLNCNVIEKESAGLGKSRVKATKLFDCTWTVLEELPAQAGDLIQGEAEIVIPYGNSASTPPGPGYPRVEWQLSAVTRLAGGQQSAVILPVHVAATGGGTAQLKRTNVALRA